MLACLGYTLFYWYYGFEDLSLLFTFCDRLLSFVANEVDSVRRALNQKSRVRKPMSQKCQISGSNVSTWQRFAPSQSTTVISVKRED